ncbi:competence protein CoiA [Neobacillus jeddahensis]|uniref:competence protein CoiA n=1 Tax=Neobacillus jeddahensis TaxID=1461580 RepID=UPI000694AD40|nr:competence protein CoiA family protein [Neobacillus jeddahensis]
MLTARTITGKKICLGFDYTKESLLSLRNKEEFICPICGEGVVLKLGDRRIFHFAHKQGSSCRDVYENESFYHMEGKRQLFQWLVRQKIPAALEYYISDIQQRPDILFKFNDKTYALEYQCSTIPENVFFKRTKSYLDHHYIPLWILSSDQIHQKRKTLIGLSNFQYLFVRSTSTGNLYIPSYCPEQRQFRFVESITSFSIKNAFFHSSIYPKKYTTVEDVLEPNMSKTINLSSWNSEMEKLILNWSVHPQPGQLHFFQEIYNRGLNLFLMPPEIGLPVAHSLLLQTPLIIWQTYFYLDVLADKDPNDTISFHEIKDHFNKRKYRNDIMRRNLPQIEQLNPILPIIEYMMLLERLGIVRRKSDSLFEVQRKITIPISNREREEARGDFYKKNRRILLIQ